MSFPRTHRLTTKTEFKSVFDKSHKVSQKHVLILFHSNEKELARFGVIVGKRVASDAVVRNRIKRVMRESFRHNQEKLSGLDIVIIARHECDTLDNKKLRKGIDDLWEKLLKQSQSQSYIR